MTSSSAILRGRRQGGPASPEAGAPREIVSLQKEHDAAIRCFHRAIAVAPRFAYAYTLCGHEYVSR